MADKTPEEEWTETCSPSLHFLRMQVANTAREMRKGHSYGEFSKDSAWHRPQEADATPLKLTVDLTVKPLKPGENVGISEKNKITAMRLKRPGRRVEHAEAST